MTHDSSSSENLSANQEESQTEEKPVQESWIGQVIDRAKSNDKFSSDAEIINAQSLAAIASGKQNKNKQPKKEIQAFEPLYLFENTKDFFRLAFLCEQEEPSFEKRSSSFYLL